MNDSNCYLKGLALIVFSIAMLCIMLTMANADTLEGQETQAPITEASEPSEPSRAVARPLRSKASTIVGYTVHEYEDEEETEAVITPQEPEPVVESKVYFDIPMSRVLQDHVYNTAEQFGLDPILVFAIIEEESLYRNIVSKTNDYGLMQINEINFEWLKEHYGITNLLDPGQNIVAGCALLKWTAQFTNGSTEQLLMFYGRGVGRGRELWAQGVRTLPFMEKVFAIMNEFKRGERNDRNKRGLQVSALRRDL